MARGQQNFLQQNPTVINWKWWLTQAELYNGRKTVVVVVIVE